MVAYKTQAALSELKVKRETRKKAATAKFAKALAAANGAVHHAVSWREAGWSLRRIAEQFIESGIKTPRGASRWTTTQAARLLRLAERQKQSH